MATITLTIDNALVPRILAAFNNERAYQTPPGGDVPDPTTAADVKTFLIDALRREVQSIERRIEREAITDDALEIT